MGMGIQVQARDPTPGGIKVEAALTAKDRTAVSHGKGGSRVEPK